MESSLSSNVKALVEMIKQEIFQVIDPHSLIASSAYDTAWLAMIPESSDPSQPMFKNCLDWVITNQKEEGFWGECDGHGMPTVECLPATLACMIALKKWNVGQTMINKGMAFIQANAKKLIGDIYESCPRWFAIIFPAMLELAHTNGLKIIFPDRLKGAVMNTFYKRQEILEGEKLVDKCRYPPLLAYVEALPLYNIDQEHMVNHLCNDGSLFQSPSATARAFMVTGNKDCLGYLQSVVKKFPNGVPPTYPMDEELIKLCVVNQLHRLGLPEHFQQEIEEVLEHVYRNYMNQESNKNQSIQLHKSYTKTLWHFGFCECMDIMYHQIINLTNELQILFSFSGIFCWFLHDEEIQDRIENNPEFFSSVMLYVHKATDLMFSGEHELDKAKSFSRKLLEKSISMEIRSQKNFSIPNFHTMIKHELRFPWLARLEHLEHRMWIEEKNITALWMEKASFHRISSIHNNKLMQLATQNFEFRQSIYVKELEELKRWSKDWGLIDMGFGREKTTYCYFAVAASTSLPPDSGIRMLVAKGGIIITVADDFYDMEGSLDDLQKLTDAVQRWDATGLSGHSRTIFNVLDNLVREMADKHLKQEGTDITKRLRCIWYETFNAWFTEAKWTKSEFRPSEEEYLETGMTSIATHTLVLPASCFLSPSIPKQKLEPGQYEKITKLLMVIPRLLNDMQSYEKEQKEGKTNFVLLHLEKNPETELEDSITFVKEMVAEKKREFIEHALMDGYNDLSTQCRHLHLSCLKVFQMFFDSSNRYDSSTEMLQDIQKAIYLPIEVGPSNPLKIPQAPIPLMLPSTQPSGSPKRYRQTVVNYHQLDQRFKNHSVCYPAKLVSWPRSRNRSLNITIPVNFKFCLI